MTQAKTSRNNVMINPDDAVMLLIDHQSGLFQLVKDIPVPELRRNAIALAKVVTLLKIPVITTASVPDSPNADIHQAAPHASTWRVKARSNAWDMPTFVQAIEATGRRTLIIAGTLTSVCLAFPSISAVAAG
jgi:nicotinamidase-related amidase